MQNWQNCQSPHGFKQLNLHWKTYIVIDKSLHNCQSPRTDRLLTQFKNNEKIDIIGRGGLDRTLSNLFDPLKVFHNFSLYRI